MNKISSSSKTQRLIKESRQFCQSGRLEEARLIYEDLLKIIPLHPEVLGNLGTIELQNGNTELGIAHLKKSISIDPLQFNFLINLGNGLLDLNNADESLFYYEAARKINSRSTIVFYNRGRALKSLKRYQEAIESYESSIKLDAHNYLSYMNLGFIMNEQGRYQEALKNYNLAIEIAPKNYELFYNRGIVYSNLNLQQLALDDFDESFRLNPEFKQSLYNQSFIKLASQSFQDGWQLYESRWKSSEKDKYLKTSRPELTDFNVEDKIIFIWAEQGIGDQILYSSLLYDAFKTQNHFYISLDPRLIPLYKRSFSHLDHVTFISIHERLAESKYDFHLPIGNLGKFFRNSIEDFNSHPKAYLKTDEIQVHALRSKIKKNAQNICGISWMSKNIDVGKEKSLSLTELLPILSIPNITFINLQYGDTKEEVGKVLDQHGIEIHMIDEIDNFNNLDGLASLINACDYVVTTSNVTAHIAGALNKDTYLLIPYAHGRIWYWGESESKCLWYPAIHIYQCDDSGSWDHPIKQLSAQMKDMVYD
jgi:tetratricopeptide (TPR) repeat protein